MRPISIEFQAFGPYIKNVNINFDDLSSNGLFLICGDTGSGKTTILEAMTFALYGKSSGGKRGGLEQMRCKNAPDDLATYVKFEFENNGNYYVFERRLEKKRVNIHKSVNAMQKDANGQWQVLFENPKETDLNKKAVEILGLEYSQFVQVIILPQGKFEELLTSTSEEKEKILTSIFGEDKWQIIADKIYEKASKKKEDLKEIKNATQNSLNEENCASIEELGDLIAGRKEESVKLKEEFEKIDYSKIIKDNQDKLILVRAFEDLENKEEKARLLEEKKTEREVWEKKAKEAKRADKVRLVMEKVATSRQSYKERLANKDLAEEKANEAKALSESVEAAYKEHLAMEPLMDNKKVQKATFEGKIETYEGINKALSQLNAAKIKEQSAILEENVAKEKCEEIDERIVILKREYDGLKTEHQELLDARILGITGELASKLIEGSACPVCGSKEHPHKAEISPNNVTKEQVEEKKNEVDIKYSELEKADAEKVAAQENAMAKHAAVEKAHNSVIECEISYESMKNNMIEDIFSLDELMLTIERLAEQIESYVKTRAELENRAKETKEKYTNAKAKVEPANVELEKAKQLLSEAEGLLKEVVLENGFETVDDAVVAMLDENEVADLLEACNKYDADVKNTIDELCKLKEELSGKEKPDAEAIRGAIAAANEARETYAKKAGVLDSEVDRLVQKEAKIKKMLEGFEDKLLQVEADWSMAKKLRGDMGIGLQRYVLGIMFASVVAEANKKLELFRDGKYRLVRSDEKSSGTNKSGLELKIIDKYSDDKEGRFVSTLSGGEKFLASLALAIGMSSVAKRGGIKIDAMFIDEGFGSLDVKCIDDAMNILNTIQKANGTVGIISHMELLRERIPTKLMAVSNGKDSHIEYIIG